MNIRRESPFGSHFMCDSAGAPSDREADDVYATMTRVRAWDRTITEGWMPLPSGGRIRLSSPLRDPEYEPGE